MRRWLILCLLLTPTACKKETTVNGRPVSHWIRELKSPYPTARLNAANNLSLVGPEARPAVPGLIELLKDKDALVRFSAAQALAKFAADARAAVPLLEELADKDEHPAVRDQAQATLARIEAASP